VYAESMDFKGVGKVENYFTNMTKVLLWKTTNKSYKNKLHISIA
jgi:hypothetical protein